MLLESWHSVPVQVKRSVIASSRQPNATAARLLFVFTLGLVWHAVFVEGVMDPLLRVGEPVEVDPTKREFPYYEWQGPSQSFRRHDTDGTGTISLQEWAKRNSDEEGFHMGDCNGDQVLTWHEYHQLRFWGRQCPSY